MQHDLLGDGTYSMLLYTRSVPPEVPNRRNDKFHKSLLIMTNLKTSILAALIITACLGCSTIEKLRSSTENTNTVVSPANNAPASNSVAKDSPCTNRYMPVVDGAVKTYKMSVGGKDTRIVQAYSSGASEFTEETSVGGTSVKHEWKCTNDGLVAANPGSMMTSSAGQTEPKHISGVTLPKESEIQVGREWTTVYQSNGKSPAGDISTEVTIKNKVVAMDDEVKVPAGTFKAVKVEAIIEVAMKLGNGNVPVPPIKTHIWFAPGVGMIKNTVLGGSLGAGSGMEYSGDK